MPTKICRICKIEKDISLLEKNKRLSYGVDAICKYCSNEKNKKRQRKFFEPIKDLDGEIWKNIIGYEGYYQVSNLSRIRSVERNIISSNGKIHLRKPVLIKQHLTNKKYLRVELNKNGIAKKHLIHRLVAMSFNDNPENKPHVNHKKRNKNNNTPDNLEWCTPLENTHDAMNYGFGKLTAEDVLMIRKLNEFLLHKQIAPMFGIAKSTVSSIVCRKRWYHI